jgi:hypothetical protein
MMAWQTNIVPPATAQMRKIQVIVHPPIVGDTVVLKGYRRIRIFVETGPILAAEERDLRRRSSFSL